MKPHISTFPLLEFSTAKPRVTLSHHSHSRPQSSFRTRPTSDVIMQLSPLKPSKPSNQETFTCLQALYFDSPTSQNSIFAGIKEFDNNDRNFIQVFFAPPSHEYKEVV